MPRLFVAIPLGGLADALRPLLAGLEDVRWTPPERLHVTLRFAGELSDDAAARLRHGLAEVRSPPIEVELHGVGRFDLGQGRGAVWAGVHASDALRRLRAACEAAAIRADLAPDERHWLPHVTVAYTGQAPSDQLASWLERHRGFRAAPTAAPAFGLYESLRTGRELEYRLVQSYGLAG